jgi:aminopeptidase YwaD
MFKSIGSVTTRTVSQLCAAGFVIAALSFSAAANAADWVVQPQWVKAHEDFLAGPALEGRGSATRNEAIAAAYVASQFESFGLKTAPGMSAYTQVARILQPRLAGTPKLTLAGGQALSSLSLIAGAGDVRGRFAVFDSANPADVPDSAIVVATNPSISLRELASEASAKHVKLVIAPQSDASQKLFEAIGGKTMLRSHLEGVGAEERVTLATLSASDIALLKKTAGAELALAAPTANDVAETTNAIGYLPGTDPNAGYLLITAHLDHLGVQQGTVMPGANDDASGTTAVIELAHALSAGPPLRRGILFVCYGSEELGGFGSRYFGAHPPVPLSSIVANLELEMIGAQDPKLPAGHLMMTGFERSNFGEILKKNGALISSDPYPEEHFFQRSDNYSLALQGIVAHTVSGWAVVPTYHQPTDTVANLNIPFMTTAIQSLINPLRAVANGSETPQWKAGGRPSE